MLLLVLLLQLLLVLLLVVRSVGRLLLLLEVLDVGAGLRKRLVAVRVGSRGCCNLLLLLHSRGELLLLVVEGSVLLLLLLRVLLLRGVGSRCVGVGILLLLLLLMLLHVGCVSFVLLALLSRCCHRSGGGGRIRRGRSNCRRCSDRGGRR